jgi:hypothetical protein
MDYRVEVLPACRIAGLDRNRFNEAVHAGNYPCAPATAKGSRRLFNETDLIALYVYARLLEEGSAPRPAGVIACSVGALARDFPDETLIHVGRAEDGEQVTLPGKNVGELKSGLSFERTEGRARLVSVRTFDIGNVRAIVREKVEQEKNLLPSYLGVFDGDDSK